MNHRSPQEMLLNLAEARQELEATEDDVTREVLEMAWWQATRVFMQMGDVSEEERLKILPMEPFDMLFYMQCIKRLVHRKGVLISLLSGDLDAANPIRDSPL